MNSMNEGEENSETIPLDLNIEILTRLPTKSIARFRCVSKLWGSTLHSPIFTDSFLTISSSRPKLLFTCLLGGKTFFFTSPQPQNSSSIILTANFHMSFSIDCPIDICRPIHGLVCGLTSYGKLGTMSLICNPSTGQSLTLPEVKTCRDERMISYLGYDPIDKLFKVLCMTLSNYPNGNGRVVSDNHQVLTLGSRKKMSWQRIKCDVTHVPSIMERLHDHYVYDWVCINGVLYYLAWVRDDDKFLGVVCFDIRSEKFKCIRQAQGMKATRKSFLVNYKCKLATLQPNIVNGIYAGIQLWVLEDAEKHQWSSSFYVLPTPWNIIYEENKLYFIGTTSTGEIVLSAGNVSDSFYLLYYNPERNTITRVEIKGMEAFKYQHVYTFLDHVEDVKLMTDD